jgi:transcriptional regulator with XRE-family HTH domain
MPVSLSELGDQVKSAREDQKLSQQELADALKPALVNRSHIAHLEQGRRVPPTDALQAICTRLNVPHKYWQHFADSSYRIRLDFEEVLSELSGRPVTLRFLDEHAHAIAGDLISKFFGSSLTEQQALDTLNSILVFYDVRPISPEFFARYLGTEIAKTPKAFGDAVKAFQSEAIRLFSTMAAAYDAMNTRGSLAKHLSPLQPRDPKAYHARTPWAIDTIDEARLPDLGYISADRVRKENAERQNLVDFLNSLADKVEKDGKTAVTQSSEKMRRRMSSLLRKFESRLEHDFVSPLFAPDADGLRREAARLAPKQEGDLAVIEKTQGKGQRNLAAYLAADYLDVYVATSMRSDADFVSVNRFARDLFDHPDVKPLHLRYFNPTQSWIDDRVAKGLVEALMLRRASLTIYMAQKTDTFGKDSEASVALGQGKPVIVYVPKLSRASDGVDSEAIGAMTRGDLERALDSEGTADDKEPDPTMDNDALASRLMTVRLERLKPERLALLVREHWADFDLYGEDGRFDSPDLKAAYRRWLDAVIKDGSSEEAVPTLKSPLIGMLVGVAMRSEARARLFRDIHPLALQVILSTGVLNGMLVVRSVASCAKLVEALVKNKLTFELTSDDNNYRLVERTTGSTARVISRHTMITNAFAAFYSTSRSDEPSTHGEGQS